MTDINKESIDLLNDLIETCKDGEEGFRTLTIFDGQTLQAAALRAVAYFAPVSLLFFFAVMFIIVTLRGIDLSAWYTTAWFDRYLKGDLTAQRRY